VAGLQFLPADGGGVSIWLREQGERLKRRERAKAKPRGKAE
jgi:hypothetical protein